MANYITTIKDKQTNNLLPRTVLKAVADDNGSYLDSALTAADVSALKNGKIASLDSDKLNTSDVYNDLDRTTSGKALDARQGKVLNDALNAISAYKAGDTISVDGSTQGFLNLEAIADTGSQIWVTIPLPKPVVASAISITGLTAGDTLHIRAVNGLITTTIGSTTIYKNELSLLVYCAVTTGSLSAVKDTPLSVIWSGTITFS